MSLIEAGDPLVQCVTLYRPLPLLLRWDVAPFLLLYPTLIAAHVYDTLVHPPLSLEPVTAEDSALQQQQQQQQQQQLVAVATLVGLALTLLLHVLLFFATQWSVRVACMVGYRRVSAEKVRMARFAHVQPVPNAGAARIVPVTHGQAREEEGKIGKEEAVEELVVAGQGDGGQEASTTSFSMQNVVFRFSEKTGLFSRLDYPTCRPLSSFAQWTGHASEAQENAARRKWGDNDFAVPLPSFMELFQEHLLAPFFLFQLLCLMLWSLDEYWYYSFFTLAMLLIFESMLCKQRQNSLQMLRDMRRQPFEIQVFRRGRWSRVSSSTIVPGDIISLRTAGGESSSGGSTGTGKSKSRKAQQQQQQPPPPRARSQELYVPCDALLINGDCVVNEAMLTGESLPQMKQGLLAAKESGLDDVASALNIHSDGAGEPESKGASAQADEEGVWNAAVDLDDPILMDAGLRRMVLSGGTQVVQHTAAVKRALPGCPAFSIPTPPDQGCVALAVRTGYGTVQGQLMRTILHASERVTSNSWETASFICILLVFAIGASAYVLQQGLQDERRNRFKVILHCIMIVTSVVPPELPMELSLAVTNSLVALSSAFIYCTEPFRIPYCGRIDMCCFDKTGTLTTDQLSLQGVAMPRVPGDDSANANANASASASGTEPDKTATTTTKIRSIEKLPSLVLDAMACCHSLALVEGRPVGDPLEFAVFQRIPYDMLGNADVVRRRTPSNGNGAPLIIRKRFPFSSELKRMSVLVDDNNRLMRGRPAMWAFCKGAPEVLFGMLETAEQEALREEYHTVFQHHMRRGKRVLALACRDMSGVAEAAGLQVREISRHFVERELRFLGFLVLDCPLKRDSKHVIGELTKSLHRICIITGDGPLTALHVADRLRLLDRPPRPTLVLAVAAAPSGGQERKPQLEWLPMDDADADRKRNQPRQPEAFDNASTVRALAKTHTLCVQGEALRALLDVPDSELPAARRALMLLCPHVTVFARVSPEHKQRIIDALNASGMTTLMCGDGTNDVGALRRAHVGVSIVNNPELERRVGERSAAAAAGANSGSGGSATGGDKLQQAMLELQEQERDPTLVRLGDASIASSFTSRRTSVDCVLWLVRQGRCTLVTTMQVLKILALNCLVSAYMMSALYVMGLKQGDIQLTIQGLAVAAFFFALSRAQPLEHLAPQRPPSSIFSASIMVSVLGQFGVHLATLWFVVLHLCAPYAEIDALALAPDARFHATVVNTTVFIITAAMQSNNFVANYRGRPFMRSLMTNKPLLWVSGVWYVAVLLLVSEAIPALNELVEMVPFPSLAFKLQLAAAVLGNGAGLLLAEHTSRLF